MKCQSCGRQSESKYCMNCTDGNGSLKSFEEIVDNLSKYFVETQGFDPEAAKSAAIGVMSRQPAWEQKIERSQRGKEMRTKLFLIVTAVVFTVVGAGFAYWFGTRTKADDSIRFQNFSKLPQAPFENIKQTKVDQFDVYEMMCPADQKLVELDGDYLTIKSLEGSEFSPDYQLYTYNMKSKTGYKFVPESLATRTQLMGKLSSLVFEKNDGDKNIVWCYSPFNGLLSPYEGYVLSKSSEKTMVSNWNGTLILDNNSEKTVESQQEKYGAPQSVSNKYSVYIDDNTKTLTVSMFNGKRTQYHLSDKDINSNAVCNERYVVASVSEFSKNMIDPLCSGALSKTSITVIDTETGVQTLLGETNSLFTNIHISRGEEPEDTIVCWSEPNLGSESRCNPANSIFNRSNFPEIDSSNEPHLIKFVKMSDPKNVKSIPIPNGLNQKNMVPIAISDKLIAWDYSRRDFRITNGSNFSMGAVSSWGLWVYNIQNNKNYQLESNDCDNIMIDGDIAAWEKYERNDTNQFYNIKFANFNPEILLDQGQEIK